MCPVNQRLSISIALLLGMLAASCGGGGSTGSQAPAPAPAPPPPPTSTPAPPAVAGYPTFLSPHAKPIALNGNRLWVANTPADTVDVVDPDTGNVTARIRVGIDPVGLAVRPDGKEVWVSNHVSDSVSVIDSDSGSATYLQVVATVQSFDSLTRATDFDEPVGIAFASNSKAYVALSSENEIAVVDVASRSITRRLSITAQDPRAITVRGGRLYVVPFESNNQTQISGCNGPLDGVQCTFNATEHVVTNNNVLSQGIDVDIVRDSRIPDRDLYVFDTTTDQRVDVVTNIGTLLYDLAVDSTGRVFVTQTDARNDANGLAGTAKHGLEEMQNRAFLNQVTRIDCGGAECLAAERIELEPLPPANPAAGMALATPFAVSISSDDSTLVATAASSDILFTMDSRTGDILGRVNVGSVPRGIALQSDNDGAPLRAFVLNAVSNTVSIVDLADAENPQLVSTVNLEDPTHALVKLGRQAFNDATASTTGTFSCESCHPDGGTDQLLWVLDTPACSLAGCTQVPPRITMPIRGLRDTQPYHWDGIPGDPYGGRNTANVNGNSPRNCDPGDPASCTRHLLDGSLATTMCEIGNCPVNGEGKSGALDAEARDAMAQFLLSIPYPPAQRRAYDNVLTARAQEGFRLFHIDGDLQGDPQPNVCGDCHRMPFWVSTNTPGTGMEAPTWRGAWDRWLILPQGRLNIIDFNFYRNLTVSGTPEEMMWRLSWASRTRFNPVWNMVVEGSTGFSGAFARQLTLTADTADAALTGQLLDALEQSARDGTVLLQGEGVFIDSGTATTVELQFDPPFQGGSYVDRAGNRDAFSRSDLLARARAGEFVGTLTARLGERVDLDHPQPALWTRSSLHSQVGRQEFPEISAADLVLRLNARHIQAEPIVLVDGRAVQATVACQTGALPDCASSSMEITLDRLPAPSGIHFLQLQNQAGLASNDFIFHVR